MKRKYLGSAIVDYIIPTAVVGLVVGLGVYGLFESGNLTKFFAASGNMTIDGDAAVINKFNNTDSPLISDNNSPSNETIPSDVNEGGTGNNIVSCISGNCNIDLGDFVLTGVPEDFGEYIESSGSAGGTETLAALLEQIAEDPSLTPEESNLIKELANLGHSTATYQKQIESMASGISSSNYSTWARDGWRNVENVNFESKLSTVLSSLSSSNPNTKSLVSILGGEIVTMNDNFVDRCSVIQENLDILNTGGGIGSTIEELTYTLLNPQTSDVTDIDSAIICTTGNGEDTGTQCN